MYMSTYPMSIMQLKMITGFWLPGVFPNKNARFTKAVTVDTSMNMIQFMW